MSAQATASPSVCARSSGWRGLLTAATILIGLINPLLCVLHCALVWQHAAPALPGQPGARFYCDLFAQVAVADAPAPTKSLASPARGVATTFFGGAEGHPSAAGGLMLALALIAWAAAHRQRPPHGRAMPPPVPPPRAPHGAGLGI